MPECGCQPSSIGAGGARPSKSKRARNTKGLMSSPRAEGLTSRGLGPSGRPCGRSSAVEVEEVEEHEGLDELAEVGGAHQPGDGSMRASVRAVHDFADGLLNLTCQHDLFLQRARRSQSGGASRFVAR